jgi:hypothetical protein
VGGLFAYKLSPFISCAAIWITCRCLDKNRIKLNVKRLCLCLLAALALTLYLGRDYAVQIYVRTFQSNLESFTEEVIVISDEQENELEFERSNIASVRLVVHF